MLSDKLICEFDLALRSVFAPARSQRPVPGNDLPESGLTPEQKAEIAALMRVNHCGEICAQALYQGQALTSRDPALRDALKQAAQEETEHLAWTAQRIGELGGRKSWLNPLWYGGALGIGLLAGRFGDRWNLGFLVETERQVESHLQSHLDRIPESDGRSRRIVEQMQADEVKHANMAHDLGGHELPLPVKALMKLAGRVMTTVAHRI